MGICRFLFSKRRLPPPLCFRHLVTCSLQKSPASHPRMHVQPLIMYFTLWQASLHMDIGYGCAMRTRTRTRMHTLHASSQVRFHVHTRSSFSLYYTILATSKNITNTVITLELNTYNINISNCCHGCLCNK